MAIWTWAAASRRGSAHAERGDRRQDAFRIVAPASTHDFLVLVACDGAGSASHGGEGASLTAWTLTECARTWLLDNSCLPERCDVTLWVQLARVLIANAATARGLAPADFSTTLVMAISNGASTLTVHVGDGAVIGRDMVSGTWLSLSWPENGEYAATTYFLTDEPEPRLRIALHETAIDRLAVMTDGLERMALNFTSAAPHAPFFEAMFRPVAASNVAGPNRPLSRQLAAYLDGKQVLARTDDDKTLILAALV
ncbi:MAG: PP2C family serine/threonine-protein phosphatase [Sphingomonas sp.]